ncbi:MAG: response regulator [Spirochaetia bacterium]
MKRFRKGWAVAIPLNLLHIEDSADDSFLIERELRRGNYVLTTTRVETPDELKFQLKEHDWDLVISDFLLPLFNGIDALRIFHEFNLEVPFIIVSGRIGEETAVEVMRAGAHDYIMKDNLRRLVPAIQRELRETAVRRDRQTAKENLKRSEARYQSIFQATATGLITISQDFLILRANREFSRLSGYRTEEVAGVLSLKNFIPDNEIPPLPNNIESGLRIETRLLCKDGRIKHVILTGAVIPHEKSYIISILDITDRKMVERELKNSEEKFYRIFQGSPFPIFISDLNNGSTIEPNRAYLELLSISAGEITGHWEHSESAVKVKELIREIEQQKDIRNREITMLSHKQEKLTVSWTMQKIEISGRPFVLGIGQNISEILEYEAKLRHAQKLESIGTLAGGIAHDFNNILAVIIGYTQMLLTKSERQDKSYTFLEEIYKAGNRAKNLVKQILTFSRGTEGERVPVSIREILNETLDLMRATLPTTITIERSIQSGSKVFSDPTQLHQVFMNLFTNAFHAMKAGGRLSVTALDRDISISELNSTDIDPGNYIEVTVSDTGHGIDQSVIERIFEPFYTTKNVNEGTGLGLSVVHGIVQSLNGDITVESIPQTGTVFKILLPILTDANTVPAPENNFLSVHNSGHIMCVDDEEPVIEVLKIMLEDLGYTVSPFTDSDKAFQTFRMNPDSFDLLLTDHTMPKLTGLELAERCLEVRKNIPVILQTGYSDSVSAKILDHIGISGYIMKPANKNELSEKISQHLIKQTQGEHDA